MCHISIDFGDLTNAGPFSVDQPSASMLLYGTQSLFVTNLVRVPNLKSRRFLEALAPLVQHRFFLHQHVHKGKRSKNLLVGTKTTLPKLTKEANF